MTINDVKHPELAHSELEQRAAVSELAADSKLYTEGDFCASTLRIIIVSPLPASLRSLISHLTMKCYDVLLFHHEHDATLPLLQADLFIVDRRFGQPAEQSMFEPPASHLLCLVDTIDRAAAYAQLQWPGSVEQALEQIEQLAMRNQQASQQLAATSRDDDFIAMKDLVMDLKRVQVRRNNEHVSLTKTEFDLLQLLMASEGRVRTRQEIMEQIWGDTYFGGSNSVDVHIKSLRQKLGDDPKKPQYIETVRGVGYRFAD
ncbi:winged helix-turn-helix domain-containing protein [Paenibacillus sp. GCM10027626]|uniref:winged helix-turn-helix domain-containing protein n=1 Tax=Paenibacillus sp. GCM10027626 TaxID=3273411 RepID=UPI00362DB555